MEVIKEVEVKEEEIKLEDITADVENIQVEWSNI